MRWSHDGREGETNLVKQLNIRFVQQLLNSEEFQAYHGTANGDPVLLLAELSDSRQSNRWWQPWEKLLSAAMMIIDCLGRSWADMDTDIAEGRFGPRWAMWCGLSNVLTMQILKHTLNVGYDWNSIAGGKHVRVLIQDIPGDSTKPCWENFLQVLCRLSLIHDFIKGGPCTWAEDMIDGNINNNEIFCNCCGAGSLLDYNHLTSEQHTGHSEVRPSSWETSRLLLAGTLVRLAAVRVSQEQQSETDWLEAARSFGKALVAALNALSPSQQAPRFYHASKYS